MLKPFEVECYVLHMLSISLKNTRSSLPFSLNNNGFDPHVRPYKNFFIVSWMDVVGQPHKYMEQRPITMS